MSSSFSLQSPCSPAVLQATAWGCLLLSLWTYILQMPLRPVFVLLIACLALDVLLFLDFSVSLLLLFCADCLFISTYMPVSQALHPFIKISSLHLSSCLCVCVWVGSTIPVYLPHSLRLHFHVLFCTGSNKRYWNYTDFKVWYAGEQMITAIHIFI